MIAGAALGDALVGAVLDRLGVAAPARASLEELAVLYRAWCRRVPFDNAQRLLRLRRGDTSLPGLMPERFLNDWLRDGTGGLCVPTALAWRSVLAALGFDAACVVAAIEDIAVPDHLTVVVRIDGVEHVVDTVNLCERPIALAPAEDAGTDDVHAVAVTRYGDSWQLRYRTPAQRAEQRCVLLHGNASDDLAGALYASSQRQPTFVRFNALNYTRWNDAAGIVVVLGTRVVRTSRTGTVHDDPGADAFDALVREAGYAPGVARTLLALPAIG